MAQSVEQQVTNKVEDPVLASPQIELPELPHRQNHGKYAYTSIGNSLYVVFYGNKGSQIKISEQKMHTLYYSLDKKKIMKKLAPTSGSNDDSELENITVMLSTNTYNLKGATPNNGPVSVKEQSKFSRISFKNERLLLFQKDYEYTPPNPDRRLTADFGILIPFETYIKAYDLIDTKEASANVINTGSTTLKDDI